MTRTMLAARLHGPADIRVEEVPAPGRPAAGHVLLRVKAVGVCGSDLHVYRHAEIGDTRLEGPLVLGHEFVGVVEEVGEGSLDGEFRPLKPGARVAVDPAQPCGACELCERGHPNLCLNLRFCGLWPDHGALREWMHVPAHTCFPLSEHVDDATGVLLEPLGVAIHAVNLAKIRVGHRVAILGAGPIGLCILQLVRLAGADAVFVADRFPWRVELARRLGATAAWCAGCHWRVASADSAMRCPPTGDTPVAPVCPLPTGDTPVAPVPCEELDPVAAVRQATAGRGVDVAIEAAWCDQSVDQAAEMLVHGGRLVVAGIPEDDRLSLKHSTARRKGLTIVMVRRMKHAYPRAIRLAERGAVDLSPLVSHRFPLARAAEAFALNADYRDRVVKAIIEM